MPLLPVALNIRNRHCLIVGGGRVAARKLKVLLECEAQVTVVAPHIHEDISAVCSQVKYFQRKFALYDLNDADIVFACTDDAAVNAQIAQEAGLRKIWCNIADNAEGSTWHSAAIVRRGEISIGITTGGGSPALARHLRHHVENCVGDEYAQLLKLMSERRQHLKQTTLQQAERSQLWRAVLESEVLDLLRTNRETEAVQKLDSLLDNQTKTDS